MRLLRKGKERLDDLAFLLCAILIGHNVSVLE